MSLESLQESPVSANFNQFFSQMWRTCWISNVPQCKIAMNITICMVDLLYIVGYLRPLFMPFVAIKLQNRQNFCWISTDIHTHVKSCETLQHITNASTTAAHWHWMSWMRITQESSRVEVSRHFMTHHFCKRPSQPSQSLNWCITWLILTTLNTTSTKKTKEKPKQPRKILL